MSSEPTTSSSQSSTSLTRSYSSVDPYKFMMYAGCLSAVRTFALQPLNVLLTIVRSQQASSSSSSSSASAATRKTTTTISQEFKNLFKTSNLRMLLTATPAFVVGMSFSEAVYFSYFEYVREVDFFFTRNASQATKDFLSGFLADSIRQVMIIPFHVVATSQVLRRYEQLLSSSRSSSSTTHNHHHASTVVKDFTKSEKGVRSLFSGLGTSLAVGPLWTATWWVLYGGSKRFLYENFNRLPLLRSFVMTTNKGDEVDDNNNKKSWLLMSEEDNVVINTTASVIASATAGAVFNPFLVVRTRLMAQQNDAKLRHIFRELFSVQSSVDPKKRIWSFTKGGRLLMAGTGGTITQAVVDGVGASLTYEYAKIWAENK